MILGIVVINNPKAIAGIIPFVIGFIIIVNSAIKLQYSMELKKNHNDLWLSTLILSIIMSICGITLIFNPFKGAEIITRIVGIFILVYAILDLVSTFVIRSTFKKIQTGINETIKEAELIEDKTDKEKTKREKKEEKEEDEGGEE